VSDGQVVYLFAIQYNDNNVFQFVLDTFFFHRGTDIGNARLFFNCRQIEPTDSASDIGLLHNVLINVIKHRAAQS
jgi:hypothetical protein